MKKKLQKNDMPSLFDKRTSAWVMPPEMRKELDEAVQESVDTLNENIEKTMEKRAKILKDANMKKKIWFIRHGESLANADENFKSDSFGGRSISLSERGEKQAEELLKHFSDAPDLLITSPYVRTKETAKPLTSKYPDIQHEEWPIHEFTYLSRKRCQNTTFLDREPWKDEYWEKSNPEHRDGDGAESFIDFMERVRDTIEKIKKRNENFIVLFSHNYTIVAIKYILERNPKEITPEVMRDFKKYFKENPVPNATKVELVIK